MSERTTARSNLWKDAEIDDSRRIDVRRRRSPRPRLFADSSIPFLIGLLAACCVALPALGATQAAPTPPKATAPASGDLTLAVPERVVERGTLPDGTVIEGDVDRSLVDLRDRLHALTEPAGAVTGAGTNATLIDPANEKDFSVPLDRPYAIDARLPVLEAEIQKIQTRLADARARARAAEASRPPSPSPAPPGDGSPMTAAGGPAAEAASPAPVPSKIPSSLASEILSDTVRLDIAQARFSYLKLLSTQLSAIPELARVALISLGAPRTSLRARAADSKQAGEALVAAAQRLARVAARLEAGSLVGFVIEARDLSDQLRDQVASLDDAARHFEGRATALNRLAEELEAEGARVHALYVLTLARPDATRMIDQRFDEALQNQRQLRRRLTDAPDAGGDLAGLIASANALVPQPSSLGTTSEAQAVVNQAIALRAQADTALTENALDLEQWQLAWANDAVAVLSSRISDQERAQAYAFSREMISDLRNEAIVAWHRAGDAWQRWWTSSLGWAEIFTTDAGHALLLRGLGMLLAVSLGIVARRRTAHAAIVLVRALARLPSARPFLGAIVRWTGLLQTVFRVAVLYPVYWTVRALLGRESVPGELLASVFVPFFLYSLLRQILIGATQQITRGRPALIPLSKETRERVLSTYRRLGLVFAWAAVIDSLALLAVGPGRIVTLVDGLAATWIAVWAAWATLTWRTSLAQAWQARVSARPESFEATVARWMEASRFGFVLSPIAALRVSIAFVSGVVAGRLSGTTLAARLRAMFLRRRSRRATEEGEAFSHRADLPDEYLEEFPLYPLVDDRDAVLVPRDTLVDSICEQITTWRESKTNGSAVLVGQKGIGKTTLAAMVTHRIEDIEVVTHTLRGTLLTDRDLVRVLGKPLGHPDAKTVDELAEALRAGPERIVVIDEAHSAFLRVIGGYRAFDALVSLVNVTGERVFWLLIFNRHTWSFLNASRSRIHYFRRVIELPAWTSAEIQDLIRKRTNRIGYKLVFGEMLRTDEIGSANELDLIEGSDAYFRLLWESSGGNPRTATCLWLESLTPIGDKVLEVGLFSEATPKALTDLSDDLMFALAAVTQRENLSTEELANTINLPLGFAQFAVRYLRENGLLESKDNGSERVTLAPRYYNQVLRVLRNRHLLLE